MLVVPSEYDILSEISLSFMVELIATNTIFVSNIQYFDYADFVETLNDEEKKGKIIKRLKSNIILLLN